MSQFVRVKRVEPRDGFVVHFVFTNDEERDIDLKSFLTGPIFEPLARSRDEFLQMFVDPEGETIAWPNGADIDPDVLYLGLKSARPDEGKTTGSSAQASIKNMNFPTPGPFPTTNS